MKTTSWIYVLREPFGLGSIRYVGQTRQSVNKRLLQHINSAKHNFARRDVWIKSLSSRTLAPVIEVLEQTDSPDLREIYWIARLRAEGCDLTNSSVGGEGVYWSTEQTRKKMREAMTPERKAALSIARAHSGYRHSERTKAKIGAAHRGKFVSKSVGIKISASKLGKKINYPKVRARRIKCSNPPLNSVLTL